MYLYQVMQITMLMHAQMQAVQDDRRRLAEQLSAREAAGHSLMSEKLAQLEAEFVAQQALLQGERAGKAR